MEHLNITFPQELRRELDLEAKREHTRRSTLLQKAVRVYLELKRRKRVDELLKEGYQVMASEAKNILRDFEEMDKESLRHVD